MKSFSVRDRLKIVWLKKGRNLQRMKVESVICRHDGFT